MVSPPSHSPRLLLMSPATADGEVQALMIAVDASLGLAMLVTAAVRGANSILFVPTCGCARG